MWYLICILDYFCTIRSVIPPMSFVKCAGMYPAIRTGSRILLDIYVKWEMRYSLCLTRVLLITDTCWCSFGFLYLLLYRTLHMFELIIFISSFLIMLFCRSGVYNLDLYYFRFPGTNFNQSWYILSAHILQTAILTVI